MGIKIEIERDLFWSPGWRNDGRETFKYSVEFVRQLKSLPMLQYFDIEDFKSEHVINYKNTQSI